MSLVKRPAKEGLLAPMWSDFFDTDRFFSNRWLMNEPGMFIPAVNIKENEKGFNVELSVPGFSKKDFKIAVEEDFLTISAEKEEEKNESNDRFTRKEFSSTSFSRSFSLPQNADEDRIEAVYNNGILQLNIAKKEKDKPLSKRQIKIS